MSVTSVSVSVCESEDAGPGRRLETADSALGLGGRDEDEDFGRVGVTQVGKGSFTQNKSV